MDHACPEGIDLETWKKLPADTQRCVNHKMPKLMAEGNYKPDQAYAIAISMCRAGTAKGVGMGSIFGGAMLHAVQKAKGSGQCVFPGRPSPDELKKAHDNIWWKRHKNEANSAFDRIEFTTVPRYKTSGLSGDEWRISTVVKFSYKGDVLYERHYSGQDYAIQHLPWLLSTLPELDETKDDGFTEIGRKLAKRGFYGADPKKCFQPGCAEAATTVYRLKKEWCREGHPHDITYHEIRRAFCDRHSTRGDCGLEDSDSNYELVSGNNPPGTRSGDQSPSGTV